jgi:hypothetical protein
MHILGDAAQAAQQECAQSRGLTLVACVFADFCDQHSSPEIDRHMDETLPLGCTSVNCHSGPAWAGLPTQELSQHLCWSPARVSSEDK